MADPATAWPLTPEITFLNHGSFGACPRPVLAEQQRWRDRMEREPVRFLADDLEELMTAARRTVAAFVGAGTDDLVFVANTTTGINAVLRSLPLSPGDEVLITSHAHVACANPARFLAERSGAALMIADVPFPSAGPDQVCERVLAAVSSRTRLAILEHVTSPTGLVLPLDRLVRELERRGIDTLVDGAHGPGMLPLDLDGLGAAYYTGNLHKWVCAPKAVGFLHVRRDRQEAIHPLAISHGFSSPRRDRSRFQLEFAWTGTFDPGACLAVPRALEFMAGQSADGWPGVMAANRELALRARRLLATALGCDLPAPDAMIGSLASLPLPDAPAGSHAAGAAADPLQARLLAEHAIQVPVIPWPAPPHRLLRISAQLYNSLADYERLADALTASLAAERRG